MVAQFFPMSPSVLWQWKTSIWCLLSLGEVSPRAHAIKEYFLSCVIGIPWNPKAWRFVVDCRSSSHWELLSRRVLGPQPPPLPCPHCLNIGWKDLSCTAVLPYYHGIMAMGLPNHGSPPTCELKHTLFFSLWADYFRHLWVGKSDLNTRSWTHVISFQSLW